MLSKQDLKDSRIRDWAGLLLQVGHYVEYCCLFLTSPAAPTTTLVWPQAPSFVSLHSADGEEERLALTLCSTQLYTLPTRALQVFLGLLHHCIPCSNACDANFSPQVPADIVQEWLHAFKSAEALVRRQCSRILEVWFFPYIPSFCILSWI